MIDYKTLNHFLLDDKFPLPRTQMLFSHLGKARYLSKFDLKSGFWQLGVHPTDRYKTAFCIPTGQYQWKVLPFGLKVAPSLFQKAMIRIFEPVLHNALVYIDDVLLFSETLGEHRILLQEFSDKVKKYGVMLSEKKCTVGTESIEFLGMKITDGTYQPGIWLKRFSDNNLSVKEIQQFLGIVNYLRKNLIVQPTPASCQNFSGRTQVHGQQFNG